MPSCVCVTSSKVISFFLGGLTFGAPVMHIWCILSMDSLRGQKSFSAPSCDVWPKMSENLLWIFPGSNWLNPEGQRCQSHSWRVSMKCPAEIFSHFSTYSDYFLMFPDVNPPHCSQNKWVACFQAVLHFQQCSKEFQPFLFTADLSLQVCRRP